MLLLLTKPAPERPPITDELLPLPIAASVLVLDYEAGEFVDRPFTVAGYQLEARLEGVVGRYLLRRTDAKGKFHERAEAPDRVRLLALPGGPEPDPAAAITVVRGAACRRAADVPEAQPVA